MSPFVDRTTWDLFLAAHLARTGREGLPDPLSADGMERYEVWREAFVGRAISLEVADAASARFATLPKRPWPGDHFAVLVRLAGEVAMEASHREDNRRRKSAAEIDREARDAWHALDHSDQSARVARLVSTLDPDQVRLVRRFPAIARAMCVAAIRDDLNRFSHEERAVPCV